MAEERIDWKRGRPLEAIAEYVLWREAVEHADKTGKVDRLTDLLRSEHIPGPEARELIADLISRMRGGQSQRATPIYRLTYVEAELEDSAALYRYHRRNGLTKAAAIDAVRGEKKLQPSGVERLASRIDGKLGAGRRIKRRTRP